MEHPFAGNLSDKTMEELQTSISELTNKLNFAYRMKNQPMINQINMLIESHRIVYQKKMDEVAKKQNIQTKIQIEKNNHGHSN